MESRTIPCTTDCLFQVSHICTYKRDNTFSGSILFINKCKDLVERKNNAISKTISRENQKTIV